MKHNRTSCLDSDPILQTSHFVYANIQIKKKSKIQSISDHRCSTCST
jgi:hypothetical protein